MRKLCLALLALALAGPAAAQQSVPSTMASVAIAAGTLSRTTVVTAIKGEQIYVTSLFMAPLATSAVTWSYGTGTNCGTGTAVLSGVTTFASNSVVNLGNGNGAVLVVPLSVDLCLTIGTAGAPGTFTYAQY
jgi:hypothetical protein